MPISTAVPSSAVARVLGIQTINKALNGVGNIRFLPQRIAVIGQGSTVSVYSTDKAQHTSALAVATAYGFGSPLHLAASQLFPINGDGVGTIPVTFYPLVDDGAGAPSVGDITPVNAATAAAAYQVKINNILSEAFVVQAADTVAAIVTAMTAAINAVLEMPVVASDNVTDVILTSKWEGTSANDIFIEMVGPTDLGVTFGITQPVGGLVNPNIDAALAQVGDVWESMFLNCLDVADTTTLDKLATFGEGRWGALTHKPMIAFTGNLATTVANATAVPESRKTDRTDSQLVAPGSKDLPFVVAARQLARIAVVANNNPAQDYGSQDATGLTPGADGDQWDYLQQNEAVTKGSSTINVKDGVVNIADVVTMYHPTGDPLPAYRFVTKIVRLQTIIFNLALIFNTPEWDGAPLLPDADPTTNRAAKKPKTAKAAIATMLDQLGLEAIISDPETAKANTLVEIDSQNGDRLNMVVPVQLSGNTNIKSIDLEFGFFFGTPTVVA